MTFTEDHTGASAELFAAHLEEQLQRYSQAMTAQNLDGLVIAAGSPRLHFLDDIDCSWKPNPHFRLFVPTDDVAGSVLLLRPGARPQLLHFRPEDFWHLPPAPLEGDWTTHFDLQTVASAEARERRLQQWRGPGERIAWIDPDCLEADPRLLRRLDACRPAKTDYEIACLRAANRRAARGHRVVQSAFMQDASEFELHLAYLEATGHLDAELPYGNIIGLNEHGAVLHYQHRDRQPPAGGHRSLLIDAGATWAGYAADITRTHARNDGDFAALIRALDSLQQELTRRVCPGLPFADLHVEAHRGVAALLLEAGILRQASAEALVETGVTRTFLPHGLGHLLGVQTHDAGGHLDAEGQPLPPPAHAPALRLTRPLEENFVVTIEPGIYFIPMLLDALRATEQAQLVDWSLVDQLLPWGGIRIEDNIRVTADGQENLTRPALAAEGLQ